MISDTVKVLQLGKYPPRLWLLVTLAFVIPLVLFGVLIHLFEHSRRDEQQRVVREVANLHAIEIGNRLERALSASFALAAIVRQGNGKIDHFQALGVDMIRVYGGIGALQLAPNGVISQVVPLAGNEKVIGFNPLNDPRQRADAQRAIDTGGLVLAGPFSLMQGGYGVVGRYPVFLPEKVGKREQQTFWGFVQVLVRIPELLSVVSMGRLDKEYYRYELWRIDPQNGERVIFARNVTQALRSPINAMIAVPGDVWYLSIEPLQAGEFSTWSIVGGLLAFFLSCLIAMAVLYQQRESILLKSENQLRRKTQADLQRTSQRLNEIIDTIDRAILLWDKAQRLVVWNRATSKMYENISTQMYVGMTREELLAIRAASGEEEAGLPWEFVGSTDRHLPDGRIVEVQRLAMADGGRLVLHTDVTELRLRSEMLARTERMASLGKLVAGIAHEINTPIGNSRLVATTVRDQINDFVQTLSEGALRRSVLDSFVAALRDSSEVLVRNISRAAELIQHFKGMAVDQTSELRREFLVAEVFNDVLMTWQRKVSMASQHLEISVDEGLRMDAYPGALGQIVTNLIENSLLHAFPDREGGLMRLCAKAHGKNSVKITYRDDGVGIPVLHQERIFEPFFTTKLGMGGSGLGLSIVLNLVRDLFGGTISLDSAWEQGTIFHIILPSTAPEKTKTKAR